jgi:hypothetical protein
MGTGIGDKIGEGFISLVADSGDDWDWRGCDRHHYSLIVKASQIFHCAAASSEHQHIGSAIFGYSGDRLGD